ncbi:MAG TPA: divalent metal cation transporter, partial [Planctomycetaceae bacterium]|nr:divalent metal cation transporter [Planctomycetaceae bacterium]
AAGLVVPHIPQAGGQGLGWTIALMGGVGGTVTILCYGYWIREEGREGTGDLATSRLDLGCGYTMTALFGLAMVIIGSQTPEVPGSGSTLIVNLADALQEALGRFGTAARWAFLVGAWSAVFSSLLGVWQSVPYLFTDLWNLLGRRSLADPRQAVDRSSLAYRGYLLGLAIVPAAGLALVPFATIQKTYAIVGAVFMPILAAALLALNGRRGPVDEPYRNSLATTVILVAAVAFFVGVGALEVWERLSHAPK